jgi:hypothetical protein
MKPPVRASRSRTTLRVRWRPTTLMVAMLFACASAALVACTEPTERSPRSARPSPRASTRPSSVQRPACPAVAGSTVTGTVRDPALDEISGVVVGHHLRGVLWVEEDSGNEAAVYAVEPTGKLVATVAVVGATNQDWEDLAWSDGRLFVGDIGDNERERSEVQVYAFAEPRTRDVSSVEASMFRLRYEGGPRDAEAMFVDPRDETLYVIEKQTVAPESTVFAIALDDLLSGTVGVLRPVGRIPMSTVTAADLGPAGIAVRNYLVTRVFRWSEDRTVRSTLDDMSCPVTLGPSEALAQTADGRGLYSIPEGIGAPIAYAETPHPRGTAHH